MLPFSCEFCFDRFADGNDVIDLTSTTFDMAGVGVTLNGEKGNDIIWAAEGDNTLNGGEGNDVFIWWSWCKYYNRWCRCR